MTAYGPLAAVYDRLTGDVGYERRADYIQRLFGKSRIPVHTVLDLACGTGTMTAILTERGYELIAVDASPDMLAQAREKAAEVPGEPPVFLNQDMPKLDLYGTVDAAICCLDSLNYLTSPKDVQRTFQRLHLFIAPGGLLVFDVSSAAKLRASSRDWTARSFWTRRRTSTAYGGRSLRSGARPAATGWIFLPAAPTAPGTGTLRSTASGPTRWRTCAAG